jgi:hypothetical protein
MINFFFKDEKTNHICEVQLVHYTFMIIRKNMGAHASYAYFRTAIELLEYDPRWTEECALVDIFQETNGIGWLHKTGWCTSASVSSWHGVQRNSSGQTIGLYLSYNQLQGSFPKSLLKLKYLQYFDIEGNCLTGKYNCNIYCCLL